tara:strand:+ start:713 stop:1378 length:666 start_codon:yes stop_codon:yes gene_type:complete
MNKNLKLLEKKINIKFKNHNLLKQSMIHKSFDSTNNNEKFEFLGDRILGLVISKKLFDLYPDAPEGDLDKRFAYLVNRNTCLKISKLMRLDEYLILGPSYRKKNLVEDKILSDACEALIGAVYLDKGYKTVEFFILKFWNDKIKETVITKIDPKTKLQEYSLKHFKKLPIYKVLSFKGPAHSPLYKVSVKINNSKLFFGSGGSKKIAQHNAAKKLIKEIKI